ncbi:MAG: NlpC/P60 family protein, partial [Thermocrispum sp.]
KESVEKQLWRAQQKVRGLEGQRERYEEWKAAKERAEALKAQQAALNSGGGGGGVPSGSSAPAGATVEAAISRAMAQIGVPYAWGGGNANGPTYGIRDGGVADSFGDYAKIGFDCSGLMIYAFAGVKSLPHYSGYQYTSGRHVPLSQARRGDMLFWGNGGIHHVALYLGNGQMIEAPQSGMHVRVTSVRYGDILPYATRLIG